MASHACLSFHTSPFIYLPGVDQGYQRSSAKYCLPNCYQLGLIFAIFMWIIPPLTRKIHPNIPTIMQIIYILAVRSMGQGLHISCLQFYLYHWGRRTTWNNRCSINICWMNIQMRVYTIHLKIKKFCSFSLSYSSISWTSLSENCYLVEIPKHGICLFSFVFLPI